MRRQKAEHYYYLAIVLAILIFCNDNVTRVGKASEQPFWVLSDALIPPDIPPKHNSSITPGYYETSEYLIGSVAVGIIFLESNGINDTSTEDWTSAEESEVANEIQVALNWWSSRNPSANVSFTQTINLRVPTNYEPINHRGGSPQEGGEENLWIQDAMNYLGYPGTDYFAQVRDYVNALRNSTGTDWAFAMFIVDSSNDPDGIFADGSLFAYAYLGGPFLVMTYDNNDYRIDNMDKVTAHEIGHIFYATDEYDGETEYSGYLNVSDVDGSGALMDTSSWSLSTGTEGQIGWRDTDNDDILDIVDTFPDTKLVLHPPNQTNNSTLTYAGFVTEVPYPNNNPHGTDRDVTINTITKVEYRVDASEWLQASATDGAFDEAEENFTFTTLPLISGTHTVEVRGTNSVDNNETTYATHTVTIAMAPPMTSLNYSFPNYVTATATYVSKNTTFTLNASGTISGLVNTYYKVDSESWIQYTGPFTLSNLADGIHTLHFYSIDNLGNKESTKSSNLTIDNTKPDISFTSPSNESTVGFSKVDVAWTGLDYGSGIAYYEIKIDDTENINKGTSTSHTFLNVADGSHNVYIKAVDKLGNSKESSITFLVDTTPPIISMKFPENQSEIKSPRITVAWSGSDDLSDVDHYEVRLDENLWINVAENITYTFSQLSDGTHTVDVKVIDDVGNHKQARIVFSVNTSLIGGFGWTDDIIIFSLTGIAVAIILALLLLLKGR